MTIPCECCPTTVTRCVRLVAPAFFGTLGTNNGGVQITTTHWQFVNFLGSGVTIDIFLNGGEAGSIGPTNIAVNPSPPRIAHMSANFSLPIYIRRFGITDLDFPGLDEQAGNFSPQRSGVYGQKINQPCGPTFVEATPALNPLGCVKGSVLNDTGGVTFAGPLTTTLDFDISRFVSGAGEFWTEIGFDVANPHDAITLLHCSTGNIWYDTAGNLVNPNDYEDC